MVWEGGCTSLVPYRSLNMKKQLPIFCIYILLIGCTPQDFKMKDESNQASNPMLDSQAKSVSAPTDQKIDNKAQLDNEIYYLAAESGSCLISSKPIHHQVLIVYKNDEDIQFQFSYVKPQILMSKNSCIDELSSTARDFKYFYRIDEKPKDFITGYGFELEPQQIIYQGTKIIGIDLLSNQKPNQLTECFSREGSHFNIWQKQGNERNKLLHRYSYLDMDVEASCNPDEYEPGTFNEVTS